jgi:hypothetical protein
VGPFEKFDSAQVEESAQQSTAMEFLGLRCGDNLSVEYDMGSPTSFKLHVTSVEEEEGEGGVQHTACPRVLAVESSGNAAAGSNGGAFAPHVPPPGTPTLDELFPHLSELCFGCDSLATWLLFFPFSKECSAAIEAGPRAMGDMLFAPSPFEVGTSFLYPQ